MNKLFRVARHEFKVTAANKAFVIITIIGPFLLLLITVIPALLSSNPAAMMGERKIGILGADDELFLALSGALASQGLEILSVEDESVGKASVSEGKLNGLLVLFSEWEKSRSVRYYSRTGTEATLFSTITQTLGGIATAEKIRASGIDPAIVQSITSHPQLDVIKIGAGKEESAAGQEGFLSTLFTAMSFVMLVYMTVLLYGQMIGRSVVTEKTSKTVEIMLSSVSPRDLLFGKILGQGLAGLLQYGVWISMSLLMIKLVGPYFHLSLPASLTPANLGWLVFFFVLAFFLYSSIYAALGAASEDEQHLGQLAWPFIIFLMIPLVMISAIIMNIQSPLVVALSYFPFTAPIVMLMRVMIGAPPWWEVALCFVVLVASIYCTMLFAAKIFRTGILMTGKRFKLGEILRWVRIK